MKALIAKCGKTGFKSPQGLAGHERMCEACKAIVGDSDQPKKKKEGCKHEFRLLTLAEENKIDPETGNRAGDIFDVVCRKCGELG